MEVDAREEIFANCLLLTRRGALSDGIIGALLDALFAKDLFLSGGIGAEGGVWSSNEESAIWLRTGAVVQNRNE